MEELAGASLQLLSLFVSLKEEIVENNIKAMA
jgi:hypothetical protein